MTPISTLTLLSTLLILLLTPSAFSAPRNSLQFPIFQLHNTTFDGSVTHCGLPTDIFTPQRITLSPDPPKRGQPLTVEVIGELSEDVVAGAYIDVTVKLGVIKLVDRKLDLCEEIKAIGRECPVKEGHQEVVHTVDIPREVPPGKYSISVDAFNANGKPLTCLRIVFRM